MEYPKYLKPGDTIAILSPSNGLKKEKKIELLAKAKIKLEKQKFKIIEDKYTRCSEKGESASAIKRAKEFDRVINDKNINAIITSTGGDFLLEILDYIDENLIKDNIKWIQGQSDTTILLYYLTTKYDFATIYSFNVTTFGEIYEQQIDNNLSILKGEKIIQHSFNQKSNEQEISEWKLINKKELKTKGRIIGGCLSCLLDIIGTKYDYTKEFLRKYKDDNIIWYFDIDYMNNEDILRAMWHLKSAGWFKNTNTIIFGRVEENGFTGISLIEAIKRGINNDEINIITNADLGHTNPRITIINGANVKLEYKEGKATIQFFDE